VVINDALKLWYVCYNANISQIIYNNSMNKFLLALSLAFGFALFPAVSSAQTLGDINPNASTSCASITHNLAYRSKDVSTDGDVSTLQDFLQTKKFLKSEPTGYFGLLTQSAVRKFQSANNILSTGYVGPITREKIKNQICSEQFDTNSNVGEGNNRGNNNNNNDNTHVDVGGMPINTTNNGLISVSADVSSSNVADGAYQVNVSFNGGTAVQPVSSWNLFIQCPTNMDVNTVPGASCNSSFQIGTNGQNNGNILNKAFWFKNYSGSTKTATLLLTGYNSTNGVIGTSQVTVQIPPTSSGQQTWSQVTLLSPNGGESFVAGQPMTITWKTTNGSFQFLPSSHVKIYLEQSDPGQSNIVKATFDNLPNSGSATVTIPSTILAGSNYKVDVQVSAEAPAPSGSAMSDNSDSTFTISAPLTISAPPITSQNCPAGQTWSGWGCSVQVQPSSGQPYVKIISPNGGEQYVQGQTVPISFMTNLTSQQAPNGFNISVDYGGNSTNVGSYSSSQNIVMNWTGGSTYNWTIPSSMATGNYVIYVVPTNVASGVPNLGLFAFGDNYFTIKSN